MTALSVRDLSVSYDGTPAVVGADLNLDEGRVLAVLGPSGCGKSTLLRAIAGLELATGTVGWQGHDVSTTPTHRRGFALMFQDGQLFPQLTVARNVAYPLRIRRTSRAATAARVTELLDLVGLSGFADRLPTTLSAHSPPPLDCCFSTSRSARSTPDCASAWPRTCGGSWSRPGPPR